MKKLISWTESPNLQGFFWNGERQWSFGVLEEREWNRKPTSREQNVSNIVFVGRRDKVKVNNYFNNKVY